MARRDWNVEAMRRKEGAGEAAAGALAAINAGADGHVGMRDETLHCTTWDSREAINAARPEVDDGFWTSVSMTRRDCHS
jgi:hypothetical protein